VAGIHALQVVQAAEALGVAGEPLLAAFGLTRAALGDPLARVALVAYEGMLERARVESGEPGFGIVLGSRARVTGHGLIGFGLLAARTMREALEFACRYAPLRSDFLRLSLEVEGDVASVSIHEHIVLGVARDAILCAMAVEIWQLGNVITGQTLVGDLELMIPEPAYYARFASGSPGRVRFDMPSNRVQFRAHLLDLPLKAADPVAFRIAQESCERELTALSQEQSLLAKLQALLQEEHACSLSLAETARALGMSSRTFKRKLAEQGVMYSRLVADARKRHALRLLNSGASVEVTAERLGYSDATNFARAFRRWTGHAPRVARR
jgi:AraC-like DNA-binding protein